FGINNVDITFSLFIIMIFNCLRKSKYYDRMISSARVSKLEVSDPKSLEIIQRYEKSALVNLTTFMSLAVVTISGLSTRPVMEHKIKGDDRILPFIGWYPYNVIASPAYEISYIHQIFGFFLSACGDIMHDVLMANLMGLFCCQLELLMNKIQNLTDRVQEEEELYEELCKCIDKHEEIYVGTKCLQNCLSPAVFLHFSVTSLILCASLYQLAKSTQVSEAAYQCKWYITSTKFRASLRMMMMRSQKPIRITAGSFIDLTLQTYVAIVKASYSFFALIKNFE
ncbi:odorant receptor 4-like, partial [Ctenocephalides felis]|uniref:odorant receptor 4-like n=1 Tax=Ctenocephalides felis TaxID=7515 RepID=UPI000E6E137B